MGHVTYSVCHIHLFIYFAHNFAAVRYQVLSMGHLWGNCLVCVALSGSLLIPHSSSGEQHTVWVFLLFPHSYWPEGKYVQTDDRVLNREKLDKSDILCEQLKSFIHWIIEKAREFQKTSISALLTMPKPLTVWITTNSGKFLKRWEHQTTWPASWEICMQIRKQKLEPDMKQQTGSKLGKEYVKAVYCHPAYLTYEKH